RNRLSGDQKGYVAPSVPLSGWADIPFKGRTHNRFLPSGVGATKARRAPSGERAIGPPSKRKADFSGGRIVVWIIRGGSRRWVRTKAARPRAATEATAASTQAIRSRLLRRVATGTGSPAAEPPSAIHWSWSLTSCAVWNRSSGSLARHVLTIR